MPRCHGICCRYRRLCSRGCLVARHVAARQLYQAADDVADVAAFVGYAVVYTVLLSVHRRRNRHRRV